MISNGNTAACGELQFSSSGVAGTAAWPSVWAAGSQVTGLLTDELAVLLEFGGEISWAALSLNSCLCCARREEKAQLSSGS